MTPSQQMQALAADKRDYIHRLGHDRRYCHCRRCATINKHARRISIAVRATFVAFLAGFGIAVVRWIVAGFPGLMRVGGM